MHTRRLRIFAGPNGSGKTTLKKTLENQKLFSFHDYLNPDDILRKTSKLGFYVLLKNESFDELKDFAVKSSYNDTVKNCFKNGLISCRDGKLYFSGDSLNPYTVSLLVSFRCVKLIEAGKSFSIETVFSNKKKLDLIELAKSCNYKVYLYSIATEKPEINKGRIENRVADGEHDVPFDKVLNRYPKSLNNIAEAIKSVDRAFFLDNSSQDTRFIASYDVTTALVEMKVPKEEIPAWFREYIIGYLLKQNPSPKSITNSTL